MVLVLLYALLFISVCVNGVPSNFISVKSNYGVRGAASTNVLVLAPSYRSMPTCVEIFDGKHGSSNECIYWNIMPLPFFFSYVSLMQVWFQNIMEKINA